MRFPPYAVSLRIAEGERSKVRLWFPLFILWPFLLVLLLPALIVTLLVDGATALSGRACGYTRLLFGCLGAMRETPGTEVFIRDKSNKDRTVAVVVR